MFKYFLKGDTTETPSEPTTIIAGSLGYERDVHLVTIYSKKHHILNVRRKILEIVKEQMSSILAKGDGEEEEDAAEEEQQRSANSRPVELQRPFIPRLR